MPDLKEWHSSNSSHILLRFSVEACDLTPVRLNKLSRSKLETKPVILCYKGKMPRSRLGRIFSIPGSQHAFLPSTWMYLLSQSWSSSSFMVNGVSVFSVGVMWLSWLTGEETEMACPTAPLWWQPWSYPLSGEGHLCPLRPVWVFARCKCIRSPEQVKKQEELNPLQLLQEERKTYPEWWFVNWYVVSLASPVWKATGR